MRDTAGPGHRVATAFGLKRMHEIDARTAHLSMIISELRGPVQAGCDLN